MNGGLVLMAALFTGMSWRNIHELKDELLARSMIRWQLWLSKWVFSVIFRDPGQLQRRIAEEMRWFTQSCLILSGFFVSLVPIFVVYLFSYCTHFTMNPIFNLLAWLLFFSGACFNFVIYNFINPVFREKFCKIFCFAKSGILKMETSCRIESTKQTLLSKEWTIWNKTCICCWESFWDNYLLRHSFEKKHTLPFFCI